MALPAPNLDDRRFQDLVDDAKRIVQQRCPEWTDHNVSDPGVTLIETFAFMTDQLLFRLNQVPDRMYVKFLEMIGLRMLPATPAKAPVTFWLSAPAVASVGIGLGTTVATLRTESEESIIFNTRDDLQIVPCALQDIATQRAGESDVESRTEQLKLATAFAAFAEVPAPDDVLFVGLTNPVPRCVVRLDIVATVEGVGVHPDFPPLAWEAWTGSEWTKCLVSSDTTLALNTTGRVHVHVPENHEASIVDGVRAGWLRARVIEVPEDFPTYSGSPIITSVAASTVGGTVDAIHAEIITAEYVGDSDGFPGQEFPVERHPILSGAGAPVLETMSDEGWQEWEPVEHFADSGPDDRHFILDAVGGSVRFGPAVREEGGTVRQHGAVPARGTGIRLRGHAIGGGRRGNVAKRAIRTLKSSIPFVASVENLESAQGGVDGETIEEAKARGPILLRTRSRAVTAEDYEAIALEAAPEVARVQAVTAGEDDVAAGSLRVLIVPAAPEEDGKIDFAELVPSEETLQRIAERLDEVRLIGTRVSVEPPSYRGVTVVARIVARPKADIERIRVEALAALYGYLNPISGGPDGEGWPFGRPVQSGEVYGLLQQIRGVDMIEDARLFGANPVTGERGKETRKLELDPYSLLFSYEHHVRVEARSMRGTVEDLFTTTPFGTLLPAIYQEDEFSMRFVSGFDGVLAPVMLTLDCLIDYFDPALTPIDFLDWLAGWVGIEIDEGWATERRRAAVATAVEMYRMRGTINGLRANLEVLSGGTVEITDSGGVSWSARPMGELPGQDSPRLAVRVSLPEEATERITKAIDVIVATAKPAHVVHRVEVVQS